jgi:N-acetyl-anhydromuramyl-L-alanine amidase AmpD
VSVPLLWGREPEADAATAIASTATWGARAASVTVQSAGPNKIIVHHTATPNSTDLSQAHAFRLARSIQNHHMDVRGFADSGQHFTISRGGFVMEGRHRSLERLRAGSGHVVGAHCSGQNSQAIGIENEGTYITLLPPAALYNQLVSLCADICQNYRISATQIYGHRDFASTECPGDLFYSRLPQLRSDVAARINGGGGGGAPTWPTVARGATGERVRTLQYLLRQAGRTVTVDGNFGSGTEAAVKAFQTSRGLTADGVVGAQTWPALVVTVRGGSTGEAVKAVQSQLNTRGFGLTVDGEFGSNTDSAVRSFQSSARITVDGVVGPNTWSKLLA